MSLALSLALYFIIWWTVLFAVLPFGIKTQGEAGDIVPGTPSSAPTTTNMKRVAGITTLVSLLVFAIVYVVVRLRLVSVDIPGIPGG